ncbi:MAG TPA: response regulator [Bacteroidota bacterium]|nr:response regulator [Bacteroidota bacterium]
MKTKPPLRILHLEDDARDGELVKSLLRAEGVAADILRIDSEKEFRLALTNDRFDLIISDFTLPAFDGKSALVVARELAPDTPFIFVSGTMGEDAAITSLRNGATDYVLKHRIERFVPAVRRALQEVEDRSIRQQAERQLRESEQMFRLIAENATDLIAVLDLEGKRVYNSPSYANILGDPEGLRGTDSFREIHPDDRERIREVFRRTVASGIGERAEFRFVAKDGTTRDIESLGSLVRDRDGNPEKVVVVSRDVTARKKLEEDLRQSQKMESLGTLAAGIAHDFNNILGIVLGHFGLVRKKIGEQPDIEPNVQAILTAVDRGAALVRQIMTYARNTETLFEPLVVDEVVRELLSMFQGTFPKTMVFDIELEDPPTTILGDRTQLHQALLNLCVNARDAMPSGGRITLGTQRVASETLKIYPVTQGQREYLCIRVADTGTGIDEVTRLRIFEPFFTTKGRDKGNGLGLSVVYGIVRAHRGFIDVQSQIGVGTTFSLYLPVPDSMSSIEGRDRAPAASAAEHPAVLIIEDEQPMRELLSELFEEEGYKVLSAAHSVDALRLFQSHAREISAVVSDYGLPGMDGMSLFMKLRQIDRNVRLVFTSGYIDPDQAHELFALGVAEIIAKPFDPNYVLRKVDELIGRSP